MNASRDRGKGFGSEPPGSFLTDAGGFGEVFWLFQGMHGNSCRRRPRITRMAARETGCCGNDDSFRSQVRQTLRFPPSPIANGWRLALQA